MAGLYNGAIYFFNRDKSFLYYMLMQFSIAVVLFNMIGIVEYSDSFDSISSLTALFFSTLFVKYFFETEIYNPKLDRVFNYFIMFVLIDMLVSLLYVSIIFQFHLLPFFTLIYLYLGYKRAKEGFRPAIFYLIGWFGLGVSLFLDEFHTGDFDTINPIFIGTVVEALFFSLALSYKMKMIADEKEQQQKMLIHQSRLASMGEMLGNIAHQWRQPLTHLSYIFMNLKDAQKYSELDEVYLNKKVDEATKQLEFMSQTIDDFRDFYAPNRVKESFSLKEATVETLEIMRNSLKQEKIEIVVEIKEDSWITNYKNEYKQVILNLLSNAKDIALQRGISSPKITITIDKNSVTIGDNAGGIDSDILARIFEPYFSTKKGGLGIGLYMSKMIIERNMGGVLSVENGTDGAIFKILF